MRMLIGKTMSAGWQPVELISGMLPDAHLTTNLWRKTMDEQSALFIRRTKDLSGASRKTLHDVAVQLHDTERASDIIRGITKVYCLYENNCGVPFRHLICTNSPGVFSE